MYGSKGERIRFDYEGSSSAGYYMAKWDGIIPTLERRYAETSSDMVRREYEKYVVTMPCPTCHGKG